MSRLPSLNALALGLIALTASAAYAGAGPNRGQLTRSCEQGGLYDCVEVGILWENGDRGPQDYNRAIAFYTQACDGKEVLGCHHLGRLLESGTGIAKDVPRAIRLYATACDAGYLQSCTHLARLFRSGEARDQTQARLVLGKACQLGDGGSCYDYGLMWHRGEGGERSYERALGPFLQGCAVQEPRCCLHAAVMFRDGLGTPVDRARGQEMLDNACTYGGPRFCSTLEQAGGDAVGGRCAFGADSLACVLNSLQRNALGDPARFEASRDFFAKSCAEGRGVGCFRLGMLEQDINAAKAREYFVKGCATGAAGACTNLGFMSAMASGGSEEVDAAHTHFVTACDAKDGLGCVNLGVFAFIGKRGEIDYAVALRYFERACTIGEPIGCHNAAVHYNLGVGTERNQAKALELLKEACSFGFERSCTAFKAHGGH